ncbi:9623_t:CDS:2 [Paraglomus occultum]|uniref:9623_t:CDS:1 n=1 Tax=Paraglomus occultum TaxID=144539 RepID=A0A9N9BFB5_9GLOM|nr:9623_t:CDS:2 [Paraglomus occultum]
MALLYRQTSIHGYLKEDMSPEEFWFKLTLTVVLVLVGGLFAGLTLGLMSLDETNLHILATSGDAKQRKYAARIQPIRKNGHLLLVTLLLANVVVNETLPIIMDDLIGGGLIAILISSALIVIFGEIIPQSICSRFGLAVGAFFAWPVKIFIWICFPVAYPIACLLDYLLELKELIQYHETSTERGGDLVSDTVTIIQGALDLQEKTVEAAMTPISEAFMMPHDAVIDRKTMEEIAIRGHSRIPVYKGWRENIIGVLLVKSFLLYNPDEGRPLNRFSIYPVPRVRADVPSFDMLNTFQEGRSHMAIVTSTDNGEPIGIITLEDVLEELIQEEIYDETDVRAGLAIPLASGDQVILASKRRRASADQHIVVTCDDGSNVPRRNRFKSRPAPPRSRTDPGYASNNGNQPAAQPGEAMLATSPGALIDWGNGQAYQGNGQAYQGNGQENQGNGQEYHAREEVLSEPDLRD